MKVVIVEDAPREIRMLLDFIRAHYPHSSVEQHRTEHAFRVAFPNYTQTPPDLFIFDVLLPWGGPQEEAPTASDGSHGAGIRCVQMVLADPRTAHVSTVVHSWLRPEDIRQALGRSPGNVMVAYKGELDGFRRLLRLIDSIAQATNNINMRAKQSEIFIVHGHDDEAKESVARFIERLGGKAIVLHEQPNAGRTIIEKFEHHSNVEFAIVLMTPDDVGGKPSGTLNQRARQNVVLELGFFLAKLGRNKVCALHKENVEIPSDIQGVIYTPMDKNGAWRMALVREMKAAGLILDYDKAI